MFRSCKIPEKITEQRTAIRTDCKTIEDKIIHEGDDNTAIRFPTDDTISFETAGSERLRVGPAGQIGIGGTTYGTSGQVLTSGGASAPMASPTATVKTNII